MKKKDGVHRKSVVLNANDIYVLTKTNQSIREYVLGLFSAKFDIANEVFEEKIRGICDRGKNVSIALDWPNNKVLHCYCHLINNLVETMCKTEPAKNIISSASLLVNYLKTSGTNAFLSKTVKSNVPTRWNTVFFMLSSNIESFDEILDLLRKKEIETRKYIYVQKLTCLDRDEIFSMVKFLEVFYKLSVPLESENKPTLDRVWPTFRRINLALRRDFNDSELLQTLKAAGRGYIELERNIHDFEPSIEHKLALFLHPLHKNLHFASSEERSEIQNYAETRMERYFDRTAADDAIENLGHSEDDDLFKDLDASADLGGRNSLLEEVMNYLMFTVRKVNYIQK